MSVEPYPPDDARAIGAEVQNPHETAVWWLRRGPSGSVIHCYCYLCGQAYQRWCADPHGKKGMVYGGPYWRGVFGHLHGPGVCR